ncbi:MAG: ABC transporter permease [Anaerolineales bacterium]|nr:ABC transporter permease [Anaerolineales bacterium]
MNDLVVYKPTLKSYLGALYAIAKNDWKRYWRYPLNVLSHIFQPIIWLTPVYFMGQAFSVNGQAVGFAGYSGTADYMSFILIGSALSNFISAVFWGMGYSMKNDMDAGVLETNWMTPVPRPVLLIGRTFTNLLTTTVNSIVTLIIGALLFGFQVSGNIVASLLSILPMLIGLYGFGFAFAALVLVLKDANTLVDMGSFLVDTFSGSRFPIAALPRWLLPVSLAIPLTYGFDAMRSWLLGTHTFLPVATEIIILLVFMVVMTVVGLVTLQVLERRVRMKGTLAQH